MIPSLTNNNLPLDTIEALAWASNLDWGFDKHPPMSAFIVEIFYQFFGSNDWAYYLLSQIFIVFSFFVIFQFSKEILNNEILALISVLLLEGIYFYNFTTPEFNVNVCQIPFWVLTVYYSWKIFNQKIPQFKDCVIVGIFAVGGFLSKYLFIYLLIAIVILFIYLTVLKKEKRFHFNYLISVEVFLVLLIPHLIWLFNNDFITITYGLERSGLDSSTFLDHLIYPIIFILKQVGILIPFFGMLYFLIKKIKINYNFKDKKFLFLLTINILPILLILFTSMIMGSKIRTMWMTPFYLFFGTLLVYIFQMYIVKQNYKSFIISFLILFLLSPITYAYISITENDKRTDYPGKQIADKVQLRWNKEFKEPINVVLGNEWNAGNLSYHLKTRPVWDGEVNQNKLDNYKVYICIDNICLGSK
ncbi:glycosyltransferase family 39 protein [Candidatus Pelagibacter sp.]|nr:glycosyltransferase family 39 protein [Candidatus Pelagibacter sp.]